MFTYEIKNLIEYKQYLLEVEEYLSIIDTSPQIARVKYDNYNDEFEIWTNDYGYFKFKVRKKEIK